MSWDTTHINGKLRVSSMPYLYDIAEGNVPDHSAVRIFGHNATQSTVISPISPLGTSLKYLSAAERIKVKSANSSDNSSGAGAWTVKITGLGSSYEEISTTLTLTGATNVLTTTPFLRVSGAEIMTSGTLLSNKGVISIASSNTALDLCTIRAGENASLSGVYTVPKGQTLYITHLDFSEASNKGCEVSLYARNSTEGLWKPKRLYSIFQSHVNVDLPLPQSIPEKTDIELRADAQTDGAIVSAGLIGWIET